MNRLPLLLLFVSALLGAQSKEEYFSAIDQDQDGGVSLPEFQSWMRYAFDRIDTNKNDVIDADEALVPKMKGVTRAKHQANIAAQFRRQDTDRNSVLSQAELTAPPR
jgi:Ca2+-binding EF-hand superfamily protein